MEFKNRPRVRRPSIPPQKPVQPRAPRIQSIAASPVASPVTEHTSPGRTPKRPHKKLLLWIFAPIALLILLMIGVFFYYTYQTSAVGSDGTSIRVKIPAGTSPQQITKILAEKGLVRSATMFDIFLKMSGERNKIQAGVHYLAKNMNAQQLVEKLKKAETDATSITFLPGATLSENKEVFKKRGFSDEEIASGFAAKFTGELFSGKPSDATLEGYIYGDTYEVSSDQTVAQILQRTFDEYTKKLNTAGLIGKFKEKNLSLYEAITLASIVQREVSAKNANVADNDQRQVAQVFFSRLAEGMNLGSDVTFLYGASLTGEKNPTPTFDSPYNTRIHSGLPPGPIATPSLGALEAVANPAAGDYLYFVAGEDGKTYFAHTNTEHEKNVADYCGSLCK